MHRHVLTLLLFSSLFVLHAAEAAQVLSRMPEVVGTERVPLGVGLKNCDDPGVHIKAVYEGTPANRLTDENSGEIVKLEVGDHVLAVNEKTVSVYDELIEAVKASPVEIHLQVRDHRTNKIRYLVTQLVGKSEPLEEEVMAEVNPVNAARLGIDCHHCTEGIHVDAVAEDGPATTLTTSDGKTYVLKAGDHVLSVDGRAIRSIDSFLEALANAPTSCSMRIKNQDDGSIQEMQASLN